MPVAPVTNIRYASDNQAKSMLILKIHNDLHFCLSSCTFLWTIPTERQKVLAEICNLLKVLENTISSLNTKCCHDYHNENQALETSSSTSNGINPRENADDF